MSKRSSSRRRSRRRERGGGINSRFIQWLSFNPRIDEITKALATDYFQEFGTCCARITLLHTNGDVEFIGEFGFDENRVGERTPSTLWRSWTGSEQLYALTSADQRWNVDAQECMFPIHIRSVTSGFLLLKFSDPCSQERQQVIESLIESYLQPIALYLSLSHAEFTKNSFAHTSFPNHNGALHSVPNENVELSERQLKILKGIAKGKTNHALALELGYSVSTIRHETMRIFNLLNVSDRKASAQAGSALGLI